MALISELETDTVLIGQWPYRRFPTTTSGCPTCDAREHVCSNGLHRCTRYTSTVTSSTVCWRVSQCMRDHMATCGLLTFTSHHTHSVFNKCHNVSPRFTSISRRFIMFYACLRILFRFIHLRPQPISSWRQMTIGKAAASGLYGNQSRIRWYPMGIQGR
jgi:hypothetical protein